jgi:hypothetical protein
VIHGERLTPLSLPLRDVLSTLQASARVAAARPRVVGLVALAALGETSLRIAVGLVHPVFSVVVPPVVAVPLLGAGLTDVGAVVATDGDAGAADIALASTLREHTGRLFAVAVVGHAVALLVGTGLFLVVDTAVRYGLYWLGNGPLSMAVVLGVPLSGVGAGTIVAWGLLVPAVERAAAGTDWRSLARAPLTAATAPLSTGVVLAAHLVVGVLAAVAGIAGFVAVGPGVRGPSPAMIAGVAGAGLVLVLAGCYPAVAALANRWESHSEIPVRRVAVVAILCVALVAGATAIRVTETRPTGSAEAVPQNPSAAYATAVANTESTSHVLTHSRDDGEASVTWTVDRADRQYRQTSDLGGGATTVYADPGAIYATRGGEAGTLTWQTVPFDLAERRDSGWTALAYPAYWRVAGQSYVLDRGGFGLPEACTGEWETVAENDGMRTLALTDGDAVFTALFDVRPERIDYESAEIRMRIDTDRGVIEVGRASLNATTPERNVSFEARYEVLTGRDVETPNPPGPRTPREWVWKLFAY